LRLIFGMKWIKKESREFSEGKVLKPIPVLSQYQSGKSNS